MRALRLFLATTMVFLLGGCAALQQEFDAPDVSLVNLQVVDASLLEQTYAVTLRVANPNALAIPVKGLSYSLKLAGEDFATGLTPNAFSVPAYGEELIEVRLSTNLLSSLRHLAEWLSEDNSELDYELGGKVNIDLPLIGGIPFSSAGKINLNQSR